MPKLLSGVTLRKGGSGEFLGLSGAQPQLPASPTTSTGYTLVTDSLLRTNYRSSLGNLEFHLGTVYSNIPDQNIVFIGTGTGNVQVQGGILAISTDTGALTVQGGIGISNGIWTGDDIRVNGLTIGQGFQNTYGAMNNIVFKGMASEPINDFPNGQENIAIGYDTLDGLETANKVIAIGRYALSSGTEIRNSIAIGDSALEQVGVLHTIPVGPIVGVPQRNPLRITVNDHNLNSGTYITITGVLGMTELNGNLYYVKKIDPATLELYTDNILNSPVDGSGYNSYSGNGTVSLELVWNGNIAVGNGAGTKLINGEKNFLLGYNAAANLTTGSYNILIGHEINQNMISGNANISLGGDNLVDGLDNQINIGSVFYYNGNGYLQLNADTGVGIGTLATSSTYGAFEVLGGLAVSENAIIGGDYNSTSTSTGAVVIYGGVGIGKDMWVGGTIHGTITTATNLTGGAAGSIPYQSNTGTTTFVSIGLDGQVLLSDGSTPYWGNVNEIAANTATNALNVTIHNVNTGTLYYLALAEQVGTSSRMDGDTTFTYSTTGSLLTVNSIAVKSTASSTSTTTGALTVAGGIGVGGHIYSPDGNQLQNGLLYTPQVTVTNNGIPPAGALIGDFWIDTTLAAQMQYIKDGTSTFWIQITSI